ncbi:hypothetical protein [Pseudonocardia asaccharolytica]|uniref:hypothetical protein n=1 Tax=Pseudonocardia asaccharolytica TaxID=54010 RepID=UPI0011BDC035|nr:hypothetical protein [Pseudonocardia asaccharolytica]
MSERADGGDRFGQLEDQIGLGEHRHGEPVVLGLDRAALVEVAAVVHSGDLRAGNAQIEERAVADAQFVGGDDVGPGDAGRDDRERDQDP